MKLTEKELIRKERGALAKEFLEGKFFQKFLLPYLDKERLTNYPKPDHDRWEEEYRYAYAKDEVFTKFLQTIKSWVSELKMLEAKESQEKKDIVTA